MKDVTIALIAYESPVGRKAENLEAAVGWTRKAAARGARFVCFHELNITGHAGHSRMVAEAEPVPDGPAVERLCELAAELGVFISAGIAEDARGIHYNTQFLVGPDGFIGKQRKVHLSRDEYFYFRHGTDLPVFDLPFARVGIIICYDNNHHPEISRCLAVDGAEILLAPHAARFGKWPRTVEDRRKIVRGKMARVARVHSCRSLDNGVYVAFCNTAGRSAMGIPGVEANHAGGCAIFDPQGERIAASNSRDIRDRMIIKKLAAKGVHARRSSSCFPLQTRRPKVFAALTRATG